MMKAGVVSVLFSGSVLILFGDRLSIHGAAAVAAENESGEKVIVQGGPAKVSSDILAPFLCLPPSLCLIEGVLVNDGRDGVLSSDFAVFVLVYADVLLVGNNCADGSGLKRMIQSGSDSKGIDVVGYVLELFAGIVQLEDQPDEGSSFLVYNVL